MMPSMSQYNLGQILYKENHTLKSDSGIICDRVLTIYKPDKAPMKELLLDITDCNNPFTLFVMKLSHTDFNVIKVNQGLTLDFSLFPDKLIYLLQQTKQENTRIYLHFEDEKINGFHLSIREEGTIKHVTHLSLKFQCGSESEIKEKVLGYIQMIQKSQENKEKTCSELNMTMSSLKEELQKKENFISELKNKHLQQCQELGSKVSSQAAIIELNNQQIASDKETVDRLRASSAINGEEIERLKATVKGLEEEKSILKKDNDILKVRLMDTTNKYESTNIEYKQLEKDLNIVKVRLKISIDEVNKKTSEIDALHKKVDEMKRIIHNKQNNENSLQSQLNEASKRIRLLSEQNSQYSIDLRSTSFELKELQEKYKFNCSDLNKANQIISRLQGELRTLKSVKSEIQNRLNESENSEKNLKDEIKKQEAKLIEYKKKITKYEEEFELKEKQFQNFNIEKTNLQKALTSAYRELAEVKQGNSQSAKYPFSVSDKNMDAYYFKKFIQGSKAPDDPKAPVLEEIPKDQGSIVSGDRSLPNTVKHVITTAPSSTTTVPEFPSSRQRDNKEETDKVAAEKISSVLHGANKNTSSSKISLGLQRKKSR